MFAEYHGTGTLSGGYVLRDGPLKLIYFVGMEPQLFDLSRDPEEAQNLAGDARYSDQFEDMIGKLRARVDPEAVDEAAKAAQRELIEAYGGEKKVIREKGGFSHTPPPGLSWQDMTRGDA